MRKKARIQNSLWRNFSLHNFKRTLSKMSKSINKQQIDLLVSLMQVQPEIARGFYKGSKESLNRFWKNAEEELNSAGPPTKCIAEWKKVWGDQKRYVRHKAATNMKHAKGTGGGPNREYKLSPTEVAIYELIGMHESVEGVAKKFGLPQPATNHGIGSSGTASAANRELMKTINSDEILMENECEMIECDVVNEVEIVGECVVDDSGMIDMPVSVNVEEERRSSSRKSKGKKTASDVLEEELSIQRELCELMKKKLVESTKQTKVLKKTYALKKKHFKIMEKLKREKLEVLKSKNEIMLRQIKN